MAFERTEITENGAQHLDGINYLWTGGRTSVWSRAIPLIDITRYKNIGWTETKTFVWPGENHDVTWTSDDGSSTIRSVTTIDESKTKPYAEVATEQFKFSNGDDFNAKVTFNVDRVYPPIDPYSGGEYSGSFDLNYSSSTVSATEKNSWQSKIDFKNQGKRNEAITSKLFLNYSDEKYILKWDSTVQETWGLKDDIQPIYEKYSPSGEYVKSNIFFDTKSYEFQDRTTKFLFSFSTQDSLNFVKDESKLIWTNVRLIDSDTEWFTPKIELTMSSADAEAINFGNEIDDALGGVEGSIKSVVLPFIDLVKEEAVQRANLVKVKNSEGAAVNAAEGNDTVTGAVGNDTIDGGQGNDSVVAGAGADEIDGGDGADKLAGGEGADDLTGGAGNDALDGGTGDDVLYSGDGNDSVSGGDGADLIVGGDGAGNDTYDGGKGVDTVKYTSAKAGIRIDLTKGTAGSITAGDVAGIGSDKLKGIENIISGDFADVIIGGKDANVIEGRNGNDTIDGGLWNDTLIGGSGSDVFVFGNKPDSKIIDTITDFEVGIDKIQLVSKVFKGIKPGVDVLALGLIVYDSASGTLSYDADGAGTKSKPIDIALIGKGLALTAAEFIVV